MIAWILAGMAVSLCLLFFWLEARHRARLRSEARLLRAIARRQ